FAIAAAGRVAAPVWRREALHAAALLIDQHFGVMPGGFAQVADETANLRGIGNVAGEEDKTPRLRFTKEPGFPLGKPGSLATVYRCVDAHLSLTMQLPPRAWSCSQIAVAPALSMKPARAR